MMRRFFSLISLFLLCSRLSAQPNIKILSRLDGISLRGVSVVNDSVFWVSGNKGTIGRSIDAGQHIKWMKASDFDSTDFRDIEAFNANEAIIMGIDSPAYILKTNDAGLTWQKVFEHHAKGVFLDAMDFWDYKHGIVIGDPLKGYFFIAKTDDGGKHWNILDTASSPRAQIGEACFASSGSNIKMLDKEHFCFVSGGIKSRFFKNRTAYEIPILQGRETTGANAISVAAKGQNMVIVGGDFLKKNEVDSICLVSFNNGKTWQKANTPPSGYRSCVLHLNHHEFVCCGLNGIDYSSDGGLNWRKISDEGFHSCMKSPSGNLIICVGANGKIAQLTLR